MRAILAGLALLCLAPIASARDYTIDDMLALESYGKVLIAPDGRSAVVERSGRYDRGPRFSYGWVTRRMTSRVMTLDLTRPGRLVPAFEQERNAGYWTGTFSPSGKRLTIFRMRDDHLTLGILDMANHTVRWMPGAPDLPISTPSPLWLDDGRIAYARFQSDRLPFIMEIGGIVQATMPGRWERAARGLEASDLASTRFSGAVPREQRDLVVSEVTTGRERILKTGEIFDLRLSPDGGKLAVLELGDSLSPDPGKPITALYIGRRMRLHELDVASGTIVTPCADCDVARGSVRYSRRRALAFIARRDGSPWTEARGHVFAEARLVVQAPDVAGVSQIEWIGDRLVARSPAGEWSTVSFVNGAAGRAFGRYAFVGASGNALWLSDRRGLWRLDHRLDPAKVNGPGFTRTDLDFEDPASVGSNRLRRPEAPILRFSGSTVDRVAFGFERGKPATISMPGGAKVLAASRSRRLAISFVTDDHGVGRLYLSSARSTPTLVDAISTNLAGVDPPRTLPLSRFIGSEHVVDWLVLPHGPGPFPLVVFPYQGSIQGDRLPMQARPGWLGPAFKAQLLTSAGYAVLIPSIPAGPAAHPQDTLVRDLDVAVDAAIATGQIDQKRMAIFGHSYGGVNALMIAARSSRYRAFIAANGFNEYAGNYGSVPPAQRVSFIGGPPLDLLNWFENGQGMMGAPPWSEPDRYRRASSLFEADRITAPVLLVTSDLDYVPMEQTERMFVSLARLGRDATLLRVYGDGHVFQSPGNIRLEYETVLNFLREKMPVTGATPSPGGQLQ